MNLVGGKMQIWNVDRVWNKFLMGSALVLTWVLWAGISPALAAQPTHFTSFKPGATWLADDSANIDAHGGNILYDSAGGRYLWYGAAYSNKGGLSLYTSTDLYNWSYKGC